jgi:hypothetical protein
MLAAVNTLVITGIDARVVKVEVDLMLGLPGFVLVTDINSMSLYLLADLLLCSQSFVKPYFFCLVYSGQGTIYNFLLSSLQSQQKERQTV